MFVVWGQEEKMKYAQPKVEDTRAFRSPAPSCVGWTLNTLLYRFGEERRTEEPYTRPKAEALDWMKWADLEVEQNSQVKYRIYVLLIQSASGLGRFARIRCPSPTWCLIGLGISNPNSSPTWIFELPKPNPYSGWAGLTCPTCTLIYIFFAWSWYHRILTYEGR